MNDQDWDDYMRRAPGTRYGDIAQKALDDKLAPRSHFSKLGGKPGRPNGKSRLTLPRPSFSGPIPKWVYFLFGSPMIIGGFLGFWFSDQIHEHLDPIWATLIGLVVGAAFPIIAFKALELLIVLFEIAVAVAIFSAVILAILEAFDVTNFL